jgi:hypothetical protein
MGRLAGDVLDGITLVTNDVHDISDLPRRHHSNHASLPSASDPA